MASNEHTEEDTDGEMEFHQYTGDADTTCNLCHAEFLDPHDLKIHLCQVHKISPSVLKKCDFCTTIYTDLVDYAEHIRDSHVGMLKSCCYCWRIFDDPFEHRNHIRKHIIAKSDSLYSCSQCPQRYANKELLKKHELNHKSGDVEGVMLHDVLPYLSAALKVRAISFIEALGTENVYICGGCDFSTVDMDTFLKHSKSNECKVYVCGKCAYVFGKRRRLFQHLHRLTDCNIFGNRDRKSRLCPDCEAYIAVGEYQAHKSTCRPIKCYSCDIKFKSMNDWSEHQSIKHKGTSIEVETCKFCWKRCVGKVAMQKHIDKIHKPEFHLYKYLCIYCKSVFKHPQKLFGHFLTKHKEILPYTCKICDKKFRFRKKFTIHIKLIHKSIGFVEFDENYHVNFTEKKSENPFIPKSVYVDEDEEKKEIHDDDNYETNTVTETEGNQTEFEDKPKPKLKRKRASKNKEKSNESIALDTSDDDEPLLVVKKRVRQQLRSQLIGIKKRRIQGPIKSLICKTCNKNCYTYQNYYHHRSLHSKYEAKKCIKCLEVFRSNSKLQEHIASVHSSSKLTETLKTLLEKRKTGSSFSEDLPMSVRFTRTIQKVKSEYSATSATIMPVDDKLSVQTFFENFVPEENKSEIETPAKSTATIRLATGVYKEPMIKMKKFKATPLSTSQKLSMPVKFVDHYSEKAVLTIRLVEGTREEMQYDHYCDNYDEHEVMDRHENIPEVAEEIMLEGSDEAPKRIQNDIAHKLVLPKLPSGMTDIRIAHLLPKAPYYKIVKVKDVLSQKRQKNPDENEEKPVCLPDGTKLVTTNPLAHLLGKEHEKVLESVKNKYYKPKHQNFPGLLAKALTVLEKPTAPKKRKKVTTTTDSEK